jgi:hypothetical protein
MTPIEDGLDIILSHFREPVWPRAASTRTTECRQVLVHTRDEALARFKQANYLDCRISAYGPNADENPSALARFQGIRTATPSHIIVMIDLDRCNFKSERSLGLARNATLKNIRAKLHVDTPTVLWSGRGYHVIQPLDANYIVLEQIKQFENVQQISVRFLRFAESFLSNGKSDLSHNSTISYGNMMLRIPGSINSKNGQVIRVIHKWEGHRPKINSLLRDFRHWLIDQLLRYKKEQLPSGQESGGAPIGSNYKNVIINWIENLLQTPIADCRKFAIWRILAPYLINVKKLLYDDASHVIKEWLDRCSNLRRLDFSPDGYVGYSLRMSSKKGYFPISANKLRNENKKLSRTLNIL